MILNNNKTTYFGKIVFFAFIPVYSLLFISVVTYKVFKI